MCLPLQFKSGSPWVHTQRLTMIVVHCRWRLRCILFPVGLLWDDLYIYSFNDWNVTTGSLYYSTPILAVAVISHYNTDLQISSSASVVNTATHAGRMTPYMGSWNDTIWGLVNMKKRVSLCDILWVAGGLILMNGSAYWKFLNHEMCMSSIDWNELWHMCL